MIELAVLLWSQDQKTKLSVVSWQLSSVHGSPMWTLSPPEDPDRLVLPFILESKPR